MSDGDLLRLDEVAANPYPLGRHQWHDPANRQYPVRALLAPPRQLPDSRVHWRRGVFNQGSASSCTSQAAAGCLVSSPFRMHADHRDALAWVDGWDERHELYRAAQQVDPWPGDEDTAPRYQGSSTDAPFRVMRDRGWIAGWRWCFGLDDVVDTLLGWGPVALGTVWREAMFRPDGQGRVELAGAVVGGHAYQAVGANRRSGEVRCVNSWGPGWGDGGRFTLSFDQVAELLGAGGEAVTIVMDGQT